MEKEILDFIDKNIGLFDDSASKASENSILKTKDAKNVFSRTLNKISENFIFPSTKAIWKFFPFTNDISEIKKRQEFFKSIEKVDSSFLKQISAPRKIWKPKYGIVVVTEDEKSFLELKKLNCPVMIVSSEQDLAELESYDIIQAVDCEDCKRILENLPQSVFLDSAEEAYLERFLEELSGWKSNLELLKISKTNAAIENVVNELYPLMDIMKNEEKEKLTREKAERAAESINEKIESEISKLNISGIQLMSILNKNKLPEEIKEIKEKAILSSELPEQIFNDSIPVSINEPELERHLKVIDAEEHTSVAERIKKNSEKIIKVPGRLKELANLLVLLDFTSNISLQGYFPECSQDFYFENSKNLLLENSQEISFHLDETNKCSILTGANSGGKTTLLEHIIQLITLFQLGLPSNGRTKMPVFSEVYYFAKNKGETGKGAFENLLSQMDKIQTGKKTLILADEIESVTEPGVAGKIISATCEFFVQRGCFLVVATHLGQEIQKNLPKNSRIDGIEAKGLDEYFELIVDHNPILGKLASSTPELIIEKLASSKKTDYYRFLNDKVKKKN
jgi:DNA mismatch repair protein MutS2